MIAASALLDPSNPAAAAAAEAQVRRAAAERQSSHLAARLKLEHASYVDLMAEYDALTGVSEAHAADAREKASQCDELQIQLDKERSNSASLQGTVVVLREEVEKLNKELLEAKRFAEHPAVIQHSDETERVRLLVERQVAAEASRGRDIALRLEAAVREAQKREVEAITQAQAKAAAITAEGERRVRQMQLQLEQMQGVVTARESDAADAARRERIAERTARAAAEAEATVRVHVARLERQVKEERAVAVERDALVARVDELHCILDAQAAELRRLQGGKAKSKAVIQALRKQIMSERRAHASAEAQAAHQIRRQAEAAALMAQLQERERRTMGPGVRGADVDEGSADDSLSGSGGDDGGASSDPADVHGQVRSARSARSCTTGVGSSPIWQSLVTQPARWTSRGSGSVSCRAGQNSSESHASAAAGDSFAQGFLCGLGKSPGYGSVGATAAIASAAADSTPLQSDSFAIFGRRAKQGAVSSPVGGAGRSLVTPATASRAGAGASTDSVTAAFQLKHDAQQLSTVLREGAIGYEYQSTASDLEDDASRHVHVHLGEADMHMHSDLEDDASRHSEPAGHPSQGVSQRLAFDSLTQSS